MRRKMLGAILLPVPFAALPVAVVLVGALFGPGESDELVLRETPAIIEEALVSAEAPAIDSMSLASVSSPVQFEPDCGDYDLRGES